MTDFKTKDTERYTRMGDRERIRLDPAVRQKQILVKATELVENDGFDNLTRDGLADFAEVSQGQIGHYFIDMHGLRDAIIKHAIETKNAKVLAEGLRIKHPGVKKAPEKLRKAAIKILIG